MVTYAFPLDVVGRVTDNIPGGVIGALTCVGVRSFSIPRMLPEVSGKYSRLLLARAFE